MAGKRENDRIRHRVIDMYKEFISEVDPRNVLDHLILKGVISPDSKEEVINKGRKRECCRALLDHLFSSSHEESFVILREYLKEHYLWIVERIDASDTDDENESNSSTDELNMKCQRDKLIKIIEPEFGLLDKLLKARAVTREQLERIQSQMTKTKKNEMILDHIFETGKYQSLISALTDSSQTHVVNWIRGNGKYKDEFGLDWPLTDSENEILDDNHEVLVDLLDTCELVQKMFSEQIINKRQREFIDSQSPSFKRNEVLLGIVSRFSRKSYWTLLNCLVKSDQSHIAGILKNGGVVRAHATLGSDNLDEAEIQIVKKISDILTESDVSMEHVNRLLVATQLNIIAAKRGKSIVLYIWCMKKEELDRLCEEIDNLKLRDKLEQLFNSLIHNLKIKVLSVAIQEKDIEKAKQSFEEANLNKELISTDNQTTSEVPTKDDFKMLGKMHDPKKRFNPILKTKTNDTKVQPSASSHESAKEFESWAIVIGPSNDVLKINLNRSENVSNLQKMPIRNNLEIAAAVYRNSIFVTGLGENCDKIWGFDATSTEWRYCSSMVQGRRRHSVAFVDHVLYICGGWMDTQKRMLDDVEAYDAIKNKCISVGKLFHAVQNSDNCVPFKESLYIFGGLDFDGRFSEKVQVYDTKLNTCTLLSKPMPRAGSLLRAALWENSVILLSDCFCFVYNFDIDTWEVRDKFKTDVTHFGVVVNNDKLFVIGGDIYKTDSDGKKKRICRDDVRCIPVENILKDEPIEWRHHAKLTKSSHVSVFGKIDFSV